MLYYGLMAIPVPTLSVAGSPAKTPAQRNQRSGAGGTVEDRLREHFRRAHGAVTRAQVLAAGGSEALIRARLRNGTWVRRDRNVYALAAVERSPEQSMIVGLHVAGPSAVVSHMSAAWLLGLVETPPGAVHVTANYQAARARPGLVVHRSWATPAPILHIRGLRCTDATRTLIDAATMVSGSVLADMVDRALVARLTAIPRLARAIRVEQRGRPGAGILRRSLASRGWYPTTPPSVLESRTDRLLRDHKLPEPERQVVVDADGTSYRLDYSYPAVKLVIEVKGYAYHSSPEQQTADSDRENQLVRLGWHVLSFSWLAVTRRSAQVAQTIRETLEALEALRS